jgi:hypothetical protein
MARARNNQVIEERRPLLDAVKKDAMMAVFIRNQNAFDAVFDRLTPRYVKIISPGHALVWRLVRSFHKEHGHLPDKGTLNSELHTEIAANPGILETEELDAVDEFLDFAFDDEEHGAKLAKSKKRTRVAIKTCQQFLEECHNSELVRQMEADNTVPVDIVGLLESHRSKLEQLASLGEIDFDDPFPEGWDDRKQTALSTTGCKMLDPIVGGGWAPKEVLLFMAPYGTCKTTLAICCAANLIKKAAQDFALGETRLNADGRAMRPVVVLAFTENDDDHYRIRIMSHLATVKWTRLAQMKSIDDLSDSETPGTHGDLEYETHRFGKGSKKGFKCEQRRVRDHAKLSNKHLFLLNCTSSNPKRKFAGVGGIREIEAMIRAYFEKHTDAYPCAFILDHCSALAARQADAVENGDRDSLVRGFLHNMPLEIRDHITTKWQVPALIMHQFSGEANSRGQHARLHHGDAAGCKAIAEFVDFAITSGPADIDQVCRWEATKHRRTPPSLATAVKIDGEFNDLVPSHKVIDPMSGRYVNEAELEATNKKGANRVRKKNRGAEYSPPGEGL